jgi:hypothetical protein
VPHNAAKACAASPEESLEDDFHAVDDQIDHYEVRSSLPTGRPALRDLHSIS